MLAFSSLTFFTQAGNYFSYEAFYSGNLRLSTLVAENDEMKRNEILNVSAKMIFLSKEMERYFVSSVIRKNLQMSIKVA